ncbi:hypothetical protein [Saccharopolyspora mangrovi]|uniref:TetR family transcriptional regulator n=1 Tax=Saccharopolyspora mangrovi TaxID=3082379 RepID=A0ABU6AG92_9PSEU|nr:hypothetical protein [Saccharopolyspora sp. S2-29]MEB3370409.1 hypothetical protein [Saccharopolyspora sp. S2-29]
MRDDVDAADIILLLGSLAQVPEVEWDARAQLMVSVIVDGLRAP